MINVSNHDDAQVQTPSSEAKQDLAGRQNKPSGWMGGVVDAAGRLVANHPVAFLGTAIALGIAVGWWVKRK